MKKKGELKVKVSVRRRRGFKGPVTVGLPLPPGVTGIAARPLTIPANKSDGVLAVKAEASATQGALSNMVVRAQMDFDGTAEVDAPVSLKVVP